MSWMNIDTAKRIGAELRSLVKFSAVQVEIHPSDDNQARVFLKLQDGRTGNTVIKQAEETTVAADLLALAQAELNDRAKATRARNRREREFT